jgi:hypothetical protein
MIYYFDPSQTDFFLFDDLLVPGYPTNTRL